MFNWFANLVKAIQNKNIQQTQATHAKLAAAGDPMASWVRPPTTMTPTPTAVPTSTSTPTPTASPIPTPKIISPLPDPTRVPTATPTPTPFPANMQRVDPITPQNIPSTQYTNRVVQIEPKLWEAIMSASPTANPQMNDAMKRMALALATQESGGGHTLEGDNGKSMGPYHIQRASVPVADRYDPTASTNLVFAEMIRNMTKNKVPLSSSLRTWNWNSGYVPSWVDAQGNPHYGPKYNVDIPQMATTSSFIRGK